jgi:hypothetical protein
MSENFQSRKTSFEEARIQNENVIQEEIIVKPNYVLKIFQENNLAELIFNAGAVLDEPLAREIKRTLVTTHPERKYNLLVGSKGFFRVTKGARILGARKSFSTHLAAAACYTSNSSLALLGELYTKINKPAVTTRVFSWREEALEWLLANMKSSKTG